MGATISSLQVLVCSGSDYERGVAQGESFRSMIRDVMVRWREAIERRHQLDATTYVSDFLSSTTFLPTIERFTPGLLEEVRGIAEGSGQPFDQMLAYNLMDEEWEFGSGRFERAPGCTIACLVRDGLPPVVAQTMDIPTVHDGSQVVVHHKPDTGPEKIVFTGAGMIALNGANSAGIGVVVNNLSMLPSSRGGLPVMFIIRGILEQSSLAGAIAFTERVPHAIGQHYAIGSPEGIAGLEGAANGVVKADVSSGRYVHANHPLANLAVVGDPEARYAGSNTHRRHNRALELIAGADDQGGIETVLMDNVAPISCSPDHGYMTFGGTSISCSVPPVINVSPGPPHRTPWARVGFSQAS